MSATPPQLSRQQRENILKKVEAVVQKRYYDPNFNGRDWAKLVAEHRSAILDEDDPVAFEAAVHRLVISLGTSHTGFFHQSLRRVPGRLAIGATFLKHQTPKGLQWMTLDVHEAGPAHQAGLKTLDIVQTVNDIAVVPPEQPMFRMGATNLLAVERDGQTKEIEIAVPAPRSKKQPYSEPTPVTFRSMGDVGYVKLAILPGLIGIDVAQDMDRAFAALPQDKMIIDLRGHLGGGMAFLRMMSHLTPEKVPVGYVVTRRGREKGLQKDQLKTIDRIPTSKVLGIARFIVRFAGRDLSVQIQTEGLGTKAWHGRAVILINENTVSAGEMIAAFAQERKLATLIGTTTAGRVIPGSGFKVGFGYMVIQPPARYLTWNERSYEGAGVSPDIAVPWDPEQFRQGKDNQLEAALENLRSR
jgi:carboxyl-terminal processing protease